jgi:hypothetical protein
VSELYRVVRYKGLAISVGMKAGERELTLYRFRQLSPILSLRSTMRHEIPSDCNRAAIFRPACPTACQ